MLGILVGIFGTVNFLREVSFDDLLHTWELISVLIISYVRGNYLAQTDKFVNYLYI